MRTAVRLVLLVGLLPLRWAEAQAPPAVATPDTTVALPEVTVTTTRGRLPVRQAPTRVAVIDSAALAAAGARTVAEALDARAGAFVRRYGDGGLATLALRGTAASQTLVLLDGFRLADPQLGQLDLNLLPTVLVQSVEVMHGAASALYGSDGIGGAVNVRTVAPGGQAARASATAGAYGERATSVLAADRAGAWAFVLAGEHARSDGDYPYLNKALFPAAETPRAGADRHRTALYGTLGRGRTRLGVLATNAERGLPSIHVTRPREERQWDRAVRAWGRHETAFRRGTLRVGGLVQRAALRYRNPTLGVDDMGRTWTAALEAAADQALSARWLVTTGAELGAGRAAHPSLASAATEGHGAAFLSGVGAYGPLRFFPALRLDGVTTRGGPMRAALSPRMGTNVRVVRGFHLKASAGRSYRTPTFNDRFWQPGGVPDLRPETGWQADGGLLFDGGGVRLEATAFRLWMRDQIVWAPAGAGFWSPANIGRVATRGVEASLVARRRLGRVGLDGSAVYTFTDARDRSDPSAPAYEQPLRLLPRHLAKAHLDVRLGPLAVGGAWRHTGRRPSTSDGRRWLSAFAVLDAHARLAGAVGGVDVGLAVTLENVLDAAYEVVPSQPMPPRHARARLTLTL